MSGPRVDQGEHNGNEKKMTPEAAMALGEHIGRERLLAELNESRELASYSYEQHLAKVKADAWDEGAQYVLDMYDFEPYRDKNPYRAEADRIEPGAVAN